MFPLMCSMFIFSDVVINCELVNCMTVLICRQISALFSIIRFGVTTLRNRLINHLMNEVKLESVDAPRDE